MIDDGRFPQKSLLEFIEMGCEQINEERDFASYLISMKEAESIEEMITIFNNIYKLMVVIIFKTNNPPSYWYKYELWSKDHISLVMELFDCLNENILNWLKKQNKPTKELCISCIVNLQESKNTTKIQNEIISIVGNEMPKEVYDLIEKRKSLPSIRKKIESLNRYTKNSMYNNLIKEFLKISNILADNGFVHNVIDDSFAQQHNINYETSMAQYKENKKRLEQALEEEKKKRIKEKRKNKINVFFITIGLLFLFILGIYILEKIGGIIGLIILIGLPGALKSFIGKGRL